MAENPTTDLVCDWMTKNVICVSSDTSLDEADRLVKDQGIRRLVVVDDGDLVGVVSLGDLRVAMASAAADMGEFSLERVVGDIMTPNPITVPESASLALAAETMLRMKVSGLPVVARDGELCGLLSEADLFRYIVENS